MSDIDLTDRLRVAAAWAKQANEPDNCAMLIEAADEVTRTQAMVGQARYDTLLRCAALAESWIDPEADEPNDPEARGSNAALRGLAKAFHELASKKGE